MSPQEWMPAMTLVFDKQTRDWLRGQFTDFYKIDSLLQALNRKPELLACTNCYLFAELHLPKGIHHFQLTGTFGFYTWKYTQNLQQVQDIF